MESSFGEKILSYIFAAIAAAFASCSALWLYQNEKRKQNNLSQINIKKKKMMGGEDRRWSGWSDVLARSEKEVSSFF